MTRIGRWPPCTTSRPLIFSSSRLPASANSLLGASMSIPPIVAFGALQVLRNIGILSRKGERMPWFRGCAKGTALDHQAVGNRGRARSRSAVYKRVDDKQQTL